jgi:hypothetical protein
MTTPAHEKVAIMRNLWRSAAVIGATLVTCAAAVLPAQAGPVGPKQYFTGVINGKDGNTVTPIIIRMACVGPIKPGETGHPVAGQTVAVHQLFPPVSSTLGYTGNDSEIGAFFNAPPPAAGARPATSTPIFTRYDKPKPLPTSVVLPCAGTGTVYFTPIPVVPPSRTATVPVRYVGQP